MPSASRASSMTVFVSWSGRDDHPRLGLELLMPAGLILPEITTRGRAGAVIEGHLLSLASSTADGSRTTGLVYPRREVHV